MIRLLDKFTVTRQGMLILLLIPALAAPYINPEILTLPAFSSLFFPYFIILLAGLGIYGLLRRKPAFLPVLLILLLSWEGIANTFVDNGRAADASSDTSLSFMSYDVQGFGRYQSNSIVQENMLLFKKEQHDVLCLQELYGSKRAPDNNLKRVSRAGNFSYHYCNTAGYGGKGRFFGLVIYSRKPMINQGYVDFEKRDANGCIYDLIANQDTIRIFNAPLQPNNLFKSSRLDKPPKQDALFSNLGPKLKRLHRGFIQRSRQSRKVARTIRNSPHPIILAGDLNDLPLSYTYATLTQNLNDVFKAASSGIGTTYARGFHFLRIDSLLFGEAWQADNFKIIAKTWTDHYPIRCPFKLKALGL